MGILTTIGTLSGRAQSISGTVFRDFNSDGVFTSIPSSGTYAYGEPGVGGVVVTAYNASGVAVATTVSSTAAASLGTYTLNVGNTNAFRVEFTSLLTGDFEGFRGSNNATAVQFVNGGATNVNFGVNYPSDYCQSLSPQLLTTCFLSIALNNTPELASRPALVGVPYTVVDNTKTVTDYASFGDIGAAWGVVYNNSTKQIFNSAFTKRHVGFGMAGPNAIYVTSISSTTSGNTTTFFNFTTVGGGAVSSDAETHGNDLPTGGTAGNLQLASHDNPAFDAVGKTSLGGIDLSDDNKTLYVVNLKDRKLYAIDVASKAVVGSALIPNPGCTTTGTAADGSYRPFAVKYYRGQIYVGVVCTREDLGNAPAPYGPTNGLSATVYAVNPANLASFSTVLSFPLTYKKAPTSADQVNQARDEYWRPWTSIFQADRTDVLYSYPQAWLTDIEFEANTGDMIIGLRDRFGDQMGYQNYLPFTTDNTIVSVITPGEILRARKCTPAAAQWTLESDGSLCGSIASTAQSATAGPGDGKYYWGDIVQNGGAHGMSSQGGLDQLAGSSKIAMTAIDPTDQINSGGIKRLINATGAKDGNTTYTGSNNDAAGVIFYIGDALGYGKANGLGGLDQICDPAPVQIGNRVWQDSNNNGVQDPGEPSLAGVVVTLSGPGLSSPVSVTTNANGEYYFSSATSTTSAVGFAFNLTGLTPGGTYTLSFPASVNALSLSTKPKSATGANGSSIDSDPGSNGQVTFTLGGAGQNNFSFDAGYYSPTPSLSIDKFVNKSKAEQGDTLTYTLVLTNTGTITANQVIVRDSTTSGLRFLTPTPPAGTTFTAGIPTSLWKVGTITAGQSLTLTVKAIADSTGILFNVATVPGDTAQVCSSIPVHMCVGDDYAFLLQAPSGRSNYQWYKNGVAITGATSNTLSVTAPGTYSLAVDNATGQCPNFSCCPFILVEDELPKFSAKTTPTTCVGTAAQANGQITLTNLSSTSLSGYTYQYSLGSSFNEAASLSGTAKSIPANGIITNTLANPATATTYTVRVYNKTGCYQDITVTLVPTICGCPAEVCVPYTIKQTKRPRRIGDAK